MVKKVLMTPFVQQNSYQHILKDKLEEEDFEIITDANPRPYDLAYKVWKKDIDVVHFNWIGAFYLTLNDNKIKNLLATALFLPNLLIAKLLSDRLVWTLHNLHNHEKKSPLLDRVMKIVVSHVVDKVQVWDSNTRELAAKELWLKHDKMVEIPHGNYLPVYDQYEFPDQKKARETLDIPYESRVFLFFGQVRPYKQVDKLIQVFKNNAIEDDFLLIAGNPLNEEIGEEIREKASDRDDIKLDLRFIPEEEVPTYFAACDVSVFPYRDIFNSGSVILAMSFSRVFIAPKKGSICSFDSNVNFLYKDELESAFEEIKPIKKDEMLERGKMNYQTVENGYKWDKIIGTYLELYG